MTSLKNERHLLSFNHYQLWVVWNKWHKRLIAWDREYFNPCSAAAFAIRNFLLSIYATCVCFTLQRKQKRLPLSGFCIPPQQLVHVAVENDIHKLAPEHFRDLRNFVQYMDINRARFRSGEDFLHMEARYHEAVRRRTLQQIMRLDRTLIKDDQTSRQYYKAFDEQEKLANAYHRLRHAIAILKEIAYQNSLDPDALCLRRTSPRSHRSATAEEKRKDLCATYANFNHQKFFEHKYKPGLARLISVDGEEGEDVKPILRGLVGDDFAGMSKDGCDAILEYFDEPWADDPYRLGLLELALECAKC